MDVTDLPPALQVVPATLDDVLAARAAVGALLEPLVGTGVVCVVWVGGFGVGLTLDHPVPWKDTYGLRLASPGEGARVSGGAGVVGDFPWSSQQPYPPPPDDAASVASRIWAATWGTTPAERRLRALLCTHQATAGAATRGGRDPSIAPAEHLAFKQGQLERWRSDLAAAVRMLVVSDLDEAAHQVARALVPDFPGTPDELVAVVLAATSTPARPATEQRLSP